MTIDKAKLKALAEASLAGEWYEAGDLRYDDRKTGDIHGLHHDDDRFIGATSPATILALLAEIESTESRLHDVAVLCATVEQERDQLKAENEVLRHAMSEISGQVDGNIRCVVRDVVNCRGDVQDIYGYCDAIDGIIDAAMAKEAVE